MSMSDLGFDGVFKVVHIARGPHYSQGAFVTACT